MQAQYQTYDSYKDSGVPWLGEIPEEWKINRNLGLFDERNEINCPDAELLSVTIEKGIIKQTEITTKKDSSNEDKRKYKRVFPDDLAYNKMRMWQGAIGRSNYEGIVSPAYIILEPRNKTYARFYHYLYRTNIFINEANRNSYGLCDDMNSLRYEDFKTIYSPVPPEDTVNRIVTFLDQKTAEIDAAIEKKQQLIELLKEQKSILINQAVTKGLNPNAPMKDSGIEWIGNIPAHWEVKKLKYVGKITSGFAFNSADFTSENTHCLSIKIANIQTMKMDWSDLSYLPEHFFEKHKNFRVLKGDLIFALTRPVISTGIKACIMEDSGKYLLNQRNALLRPFTKSFLNWVYFVILNRNFVEHFQTLIDNTGQQPNISPIDIGNIEIPLPSDNEQANIISSLEESISAYDNVENKELLGIEKLKEFKQTLIAHAVTGKIRV